MSEDVVNTAIKKQDLENKPCMTASLRVHGADDQTDFRSPLYYYGTDRREIELLIQADSTLKERLHPRLPYIKAEIVWAVRNEMCMTVEDALARRTRALFLDARASMEIARDVALIMAKEMNAADTWIEGQTREFLNIAKNYLPNSTLQT
jgi:glycerol-3-phosphate dehydrogenase